MSKKKKILIILVVLVAIVIFLFFVILPIIQRNIVQKTCDEYGPNLVPVRNIGQFDDLCGNDSNAGGLCSMSWVCVNKETGIPFESENGNNITK